MAAESGGEHKKSTKASRESDDALLREMYRMAAGHLQVPRIDAKQEMTTMRVSEETDERMIEPGDSALQLQSQQHAVAMSSEWDVAEDVKYGVVMCM